MRKSLNVTYIANHDQANSNDDEGAITWALEKLGHKVTRIEESRTKGARFHIVPTDFLLFHKWSDAAHIASLNFPCVMWYFDLVDYPDPTLKHRCDARKEWMSRILPVIKLGFCTDGDFASLHPDKLVKLDQGFDSRLTVHEPKTMLYPILFTGIGQGGGEGRLSFVREMKEKYGRQFWQIEKGVYGEELSKAVASASIVVAPDFPVTDLYWSNRVYQMLGRGCLLLHPYCRELAAQYIDCFDIEFYNSREQLHELIAYYLDKPNERRATARRGREVTLQEHTYLERCRTLVQVVKERLL